MCVVEIVSAVRSRRVAIRSGQWLAYAVDTERTVAVSRFAARHSSQIAEWSGAQAKRTRHADSPSSSPSGKAKSHKSSRYRRRQHERDGALQKQIWHPSQMA